MTGFNMVGLWITFALILTMYPGLHVETPFDVDMTKTSNIYAQTRSAGFGHEVQKRILLGTYALTAE